MLFKCQHTQQNAARAASVEVFKKIIVEASFLLHPVQLNIDDDKLSTKNISNNKSESLGIWFWNESTNKTDWDSKEKSCNDIDKRDLKKEQSKMKGTVSPKSSKVELKWNWKREQTLRDWYRKGSRSNQMLYNKSVWELRRKPSNTYNIQTL